MLARMDEMQAELGASHADVRPPDAELLSIDGEQGFLGLNSRWDADAKCWRVERVLRGAPWDERAAGPMSRPGVRVRAGACGKTSSGKRKPKK